MLTPDSTALGAKYDPELYLEHQAEVVKRSAGGRLALPEGEEGDRMWEEVVRNREEARRLVSSYRPAGHGVLQAGTETNVRVGEVRR